MMTCAALYYWWHRETSAGRRLQNIWNIVNNDDISFDTSQFNVNDKGELIEILVEGVNDERYLLRDIDSDNGLDGMIDGPIISFEERKRQLELAFRNNEDRRHRVPLAYGFNDQPPMEGTKRTKQGNEGRISGFAVFYARKVKDRFGLVEFNNRNLLAVRKFVLDTLNKHPSLRDCDKHYYIPIIVMMGFFPSKSEIEVSEMMNTRQARALRKEAPAYWVNSG